MICPNCQTPNDDATLEGNPHCSNCAANLKAKKYTKKDDPLEEVKKVTERLTKTEAELEKVKKLIQEEEDKNAGQQQRPRRGLFG